MSEEQKTAPAIMLNEEGSRSDRLAREAVQKLGQDRAFALQNASEEYGGLMFGHVANHATKAVVMANAVLQLRKALASIADDVLAPLAGSAVGFQTDKAYGKEQIVYCATHAILLGLRLTGNEWNIIAGNMYPRKEGLQRLVHERAEVELDMDLADVGKHSGSHARAQVKGKYRAHGTEEWKSLNRTYYVRCGRNEYDAADGKTTRKFYRDVLMALTGSQVPEASEVEDRSEKNVTPRSTTKESASEILEQQPTERTPMSGKPLTSVLVNRIMALCGEKKVGVKQLEEIYGCSLQEIVDPDLNPMQLFKSLESDVEALAADQAKGD